MNNRRHVHAVEWHGGQLVLLDQRKLPTEEVYVICRSLTDTISSIKNMTVRGAPAIGITAAYAAVLATNQHLEDDPHLSIEELKQRLHAQLQTLLLARPTAVNLSWAVNLVRDLINKHKDSSLSLAAELLALAKQIHQDDIDNNKHMANLACAHMSAVSNPPFSIMTHCNAGSLATGGYGTALGVARAAWAQKLIDKVYANETRPWLQGARLTAWELMYEHIPVSLNVDSAAAWLMSNKNIKWLVVGADRIAANGDVANKIGTFQMAILAKYHDVKVMVVAPSSTVDLSIETGQQIEIEMRAPEEVSLVAGQQIAPTGVEAVNPVFDITPVHLVDVIVTEKGVIEKPTRQKMLWTLS